jgi:hypothetical protein
VFLISEELEFHTSESDGEPTLLWRDLQGDVDEFYEFVASGTNAPTKAFFETCMYRAMYERKYKTSADNLRDEDLAEFVWQWVSLHPPFGKLLNAHLLGRLPPSVKERPLRRNPSRVTMTPNLLSLLLLRAIPIPF